MTFKPGQSGNPGGRRKEKPVRDLLRLVLAEAENVGQHRTLRKIVERLCEDAAKGDNEARKIVFERLEGKVPMPVVGDDDLDPVSVRTIITGVPRKADGDR